MLLLVILRKIFPNCDPFSVRIIKSTLIIGIFLIIGVSETIAQQQSKTVFRFLSINSEARSAALGGSHVAYINPGFMLFHANPALVKPSSGRNFQLSYLNHIGDVGYGSASYLHRFDEVGDVSVSMRFLNYGDLTRYDELGNSQGSLSANDLALTVGWSSTLAENLYYGVSLTGIHSSLAGFQSTGISASGGLYYKIPDRETAFGFSLRDAGSQISSYNEISEPLPLNLAVSAVHKPEYIPIRFHVTLHRLTDWSSENANDQGSVSFTNEFMRHLIVGSEFIFGDHVSVQLGYNHWLHEQTKTGKRIDAAGLGIGFGLHFSNFDMNLARTSFSDMGNVLQLSIATSL